MMKAVIKNGSTTTTQYRDIDSVGGLNCSF